MISPMMQHYLELKKNYPDAIVLYRLGDFYEMFFEDAITASKVLDLTLTGRDCGQKEKAPMCGVPHHAVDNYIKKLIEAGYKAAICEQLSTPGEQKGIVKRDVVRVVTPGTIIEDGMLNANTNNYLLSASLNKNSLGLAWIDISTGELNASEYKNIDANGIEENLLKIAPTEIITNEQGKSVLGNFTSTKQGKIVKPYQYYEYAFNRSNAEAYINKFYKINNLAALGIQDLEIAITALGALLKYLEDTQKLALANIRPPRVMREQNLMILDYNTKKNLELLETLQDKRVEGSLLGVLNKAKTAMGNRLIKKWIAEPLVRLEDINYRLAAVKELYENNVLRQKLTLIFDEVRDVERITSKIAYKSINPKECQSLAQSLKRIPLIQEALKSVKSRYLSDICKGLNPMKEMVSLLDNAIADEPSLTFKEGEIIREGYNEELDELRRAQKDGKQWIEEYELKERETTGLKTLKVGFNRIFGYYIEISNAYLKQVPYSYQRKQTLANCERFTTERLMQMEEKILGAGEKALKLEEVLYDNIKGALHGVIKPLLNNATTLSELDVLYSFAQAAFENGYVCPIIKEKSDEIKIIEGRHPVVEALNKSFCFVPNDANLGKGGKTIVVTGPNMAGKSTYMRQIALIVLMAHIGSFVPAKSAEICLVDRIFTRIGASDNLAFGQSTFMVEMTEVANILNNATEKSLLILDEIGRGTSTLDGLSIALAIIEDISINIKAKTLFATHYHELDELETVIPDLKNYHFLIKEDDDGITFLYKIARGSTDKSFGVEVASLAGVKQNVIERSKIIMSMLIEASHDDLRDVITGKAGKNSVPTNQIEFFEDKEKALLEDIINSIEVDKLNFDELKTIVGVLKNKVAKRK